MIKTGLVISRPLTLKRRPGISGTRNLRVTKTAAMDGMPNMTAVFSSTSPCRYLGKAPTTFVTPTIKSEYAVARTGSIPKR